MQETASGGEDNQQQRRKTANTTIEIGGREQRTWRVGEGAFRKKKKTGRGVHFGPDVTCGWSFPLM